MYRTLQARGRAALSCCLSRMRYSCCGGDVLTSGLCPQQRVGENCLMLQLKIRTPQFHRYFECIPIRHIVSNYFYSRVIFNNSMVLISLYSDLVQSCNKKEQLQGKPKDQI